MNSARITTSDPSHQRGQSTVEFVVLAIVLVPLLLAVPLIGKYMDIAQTTAVASRYAAFEGTVRHSSANGGWKTDAELAMEVRRRFFSNSDAPVKTGDAAGDFNSHRNTLWFDHRGAPLLTKFVDNVGVKTTRESTAQPFGALYAASLGLPQDNLHTGQVSVKVADIAGFQPFNNLMLSIGRSTTVLADSWAASGPGMIESKIKNDGFNPLGPFPYKPLEVLGGNPVIDLALTLFEYGTPPPDIGRVEPDRVHADRLK
jgi:nitrate reductase NapE component